MPEPSGNAVLIAIDPGTHKCGVAHLDAGGGALFRDIVGRDELLELLRDWLERCGGCAIVVGGATQGRAVASEIEKHLGVAAEVVDETNTTDEARILFWEENKPGCFWGIFPATFRPMPRPVDDYAAVIIGRRFLESREGRI